MLQATVNGDRRSRLLPQSGAEALVPHELDLDGWPAICSYSNRRSGDAVEAPPRSLRSPSRRFDSSIAIDETLPYRRGWGSPNHPTCVRAYQQAHTAELRSARSGYGTCHARSVHRDLGRIMIVRVRTDGASRECEQSEKYSTNGGHGWALGTAARSGRPISERSSLLPSREI